VFHTLIIYFSVYGAFFSLSTLCSFSGFIYPKWLFNIHLLFEYFVQECQLDIHLMHWPFKLCSLGEQWPNSFHSHYRCKHLIVVDLGLLSILFDYKSRLVSFDVIFLVYFLLVHPLHTYYLVAFGQLN
jgi:hypothetical protein